MTYYDFRFKFLPTSLSSALAALEALRQAGIITTGDLPENMLGLPFDSAGNLCAVEDAAFFGNKGSTAFTLSDKFGTTVLPARGDPAYWYVAIRTTTAPGAVPFDPSSYGLLLCDAVESAAVLGVWA